MTARFATLIALFFAFNASAQSDCWDNLNTQNSGIPASAYNAIIEVDTGEYLLGTENGLVLYNGSTFNFVKASDFPLASQEVLTIERSASGIYIGTSAGYTFVNVLGQTSLFKAQFTGLLGDSVRAISEDASGRVWVGTESGVSIKTGLNWSYVPTSLLPNVSVQDLIVLADSSVAVATKDGLVVINDQSGTFTGTTYTKQNTSNGLANDDVKSLYQDSNGTLWIGTLYGLSEFDGSTWTKYNVSNTIGLASNDIRSFVEDPAGNLYICTAFGLTTFTNSGTVTHSYSMNGLAENLLAQALYSAHDSSIYLVSNNHAAGNNNGLHILSTTGNYVNFERENTGMPSNQPLHLSAMGSSVVSGFSNGIFMKGPQGIAQLTDQNSALPANSIRDLSQDDNGNLWVLTSAGITKWDGASMTNYGSAQGLTSSYFLGEALSDSSFLVSNGFSSGVVYYNGSMATAYKSFNTTGIPTNTHNDLERMPNGGAAIATTSGLSIFDGSSFTQYQTSAGLPHNNIKSLKYDWSGNILWLGHANGSYGLSSMNPVTGTITNYSASAPSVAISNIAIGNDSVIFYIAGSNYYRFDAKNDSLTTFNSSNTPLSSTVLNDIEYLNNQLWIATGTRLHLVDDFERSAVALTVGDPATCDLDSVIVTSLGNYSSIQWNNGAISDYVSVDTSVSLGYVAQDANGCFYYSNQVDVTIYPNPIADLFLTNDTTFCLGENNTISTWDYFQDYTWSDGSTADSVDVIDNATLWVSVMDTNGCFATSDTIDINVWKPYEEDSICILTVDTLNQNQIIWNKTKDVRTFEYRIYKQNPTTGLMDFTATHPASGVLSVWSDANSNAGVTSTRYAISVVDSCGNESELSPIHKTMHLTINEGINGEVNLIWDGYEGIDFITYEIWRGSSPKQMFKIDDVPAANFTYTDLNAPVGLLFYKVVVVNPYVCSPTVGKNNDFEAFEATQSNIVDYAQTDNVIIYPNPWTSQTRVVWSNPDLDSYEIRIYDAVGRMVFFDANVAQTSYDLYQNDLPSGFYAIELTDGERLLKTDFILE